MGSRLMPAALLMFSPSLVAAPLKNLNTVEYAYIDQVLSSRTPKLERPDHLNILTGRSLYLLEDAKFNWLGELGATAGNSGSSSFTALQARSAATWKEARSSDSLEASWLRTHGADATQRPLEETIVGTDAPFTATQIAYRHQHQLNAQDSVQVGAAISRNLNAGSDLQSRDLTASWSRLLTKSWINSLELRRGTQQVKNGLASDSWELQNQDVWNLNADWSTQTAIGALQQNVEGTKKTSFVAGAALAYILRSTSPDKKDKNQSINPDMINRPDLDRLENIRSQSQFRAGWFRSLDQRRKGDPQYLADQYFAQGLWVIDPEQNLQVDLQRSQSADKTVPGVAALRRDQANMDYRWIQPVGPMTLGLLGTFGLGVTQERVTQNPLRYDRQQLRVSYGVTF